jgi:hypothetical protein
MPKSKKVDTLERKRQRENVEDDAPQRGESPETAVKIANAVAHDNKAKTKSKSKAKPSKK